MERRAHKKITAKRWKKAARRRRRRSIRSKLLVSVLCSFLGFRQWLWIWNLRGDAHKIQLPATTHLFKIPETKRIPRTARGWLGLSWMLLFFHVAFSFLFFVHSLLFLPFKMNDRRFFNVMYRKTSFFVVWFQSFSSTRRTSKKNVERNICIY